MDEFKTDIRTQLITIFEDENNRLSANCPHDRCPYLDSNIDCGQCRGVEAVVNSINLLKSSITHKEEKAYNKGYEDAVGELFDDIEKITNDYLINRKLSKLGLSLICKIGEPNLELQLAELKKKYTE